MDIGLVLFLFVGLVAVVIFMGFKVVPQGYEWTVERFGRYTGTLKPGLNIIVPVMDTVGRKLIDNITLTEHLIQFHRAKYCTDIGDDQV